MLLELVNGFANILWLELEATALFMAHHYLADTVMSEHGKIVSIQLQYMKLERSFMRVK